MNKKSTKKKAFVRANTDKLNKLKNDLFEKSLQ